MGESEIAACLTHLAVDRNVAPATQGQALCTLLIREPVLSEDITWMSLASKKQ